MAVRPMWYDDPMRKHTATVLTVQYIDGFEESFYNVHPDNKYADENGLLVIEFYSDYLPIVYIPLMHIRRFDTIEMSDTCAKMFL